MPKLLLLLLGLVLATGSALAQPTPLPNQAAPKTSFLAPPTGRDDTIRAIRHLFERRRRGGRTWLYFSSSGVLGVVRVLANPNTTTVNGYQTSSEIDGGALAVVGVGFLGLPVVVGVGKLVRFSEKRETEAISTYSTSHRLPNAISHRLRQKDFVRRLW